MKTRYSICNSCAPFCFFLEPQTCPFCDTTKQCDVLINSWELHVKRKDREEGHTGVLLVILMCFLRHLWIKLVCLQSEDAPVLLTSMGRLEWKHLLETKMGNIMFSSVSFWLIFFSYYLCVLWHLITGSHASCQYSSSTLLWLSQRLPWGGSSLKDNQWRLWVLVPINLIL